MRIVRLRAEHGVASALDVAQAEVQLESATAAVPDFERQVAQTENRLSVLLGRAPGPIVRGRPLTAQPLPPAVPAGLPSDLLERRPDLREAEAQLIATYARVGEAKAALFPRIALTGAFGFESTSLSDFFTWPASMWQIGPSIRVPVFNAGRLRSGVDAAEALQAEALSQYRQAVLQAFGEVEDALVAYEKAGVARAAQERQVVAAQRALLIAQQRYLNGLSSFLDVLDGQRELFVAELALAQTRRDQLVAVVRVYKALGGGWSPSTEPTP